MFDGYDVKMPQELADAVGQMKIDLWGIYKGGSPQHITLEFREGKTRTYLAPFISKRAGKWVAVRFMD